MSTFKFWWQNHRAKIISSVLILLVAAAAFGIGYLVAKDTSRAPIIIETH